MGNGTYSLWGQKTVWFIYITNSLWGCGVKSIDHIFDTQTVKTNRFFFSKYSLWGQIRYVCGSITLNTVCGDKSVVQLLYTQFMGTSLWFIFFTHSLWDRSAVNLLYAQLVRQIFISVTVHTTLG